MTLWISPSQSFFVDLSHFLFLIHVERNVYYLQGLVVSVCHEQRSNDNHFIFKQITTINIKVHKLWLYHYLELSDCSPNKLTFSLTDQKWRVSATFRLSYISVWSSLWWSHQISHNSQPTQHTNTFIVTVTNGHKLSKHKLLNKLIFVRYILYLVYWN